MIKPPSYRNPTMIPPILRTVILALALTALASPATHAEEHGGGENGQSGGKNSAFSPGEHELQLPPLWIPVKGLRSRTPGVAGYRPVTIRLTSRQEGAMTMCYRLPYITEALLFAFNRTPVGMTKTGALDLAAIEIELLNETVRVAGPDAVRRVEVIDGVPRPTKANQELLALCQ